MMIKYSSMDGPHIWKGNISIHMYYECVHDRKMIAKSLKIHIFPNWKDQPFEINFFQISHKVRLP